MSDEDLKDSLNVIPDRPPSLDEKGFRLFVIPAPVKGFYRNYRNLVYFLLIIIFLVVPWTRYNGEQSILLNIPDGRFVFFGTTFFAHDGPLVFFATALVVFGIAFMTSLFGRVWCGWACPQTVFIDFIYRRIEEWTEGNYIARRKLGKDPWTFSKIRKKTLKWILYLIVSSHIAHSLTAYFVGAESLISITLGSPANHWGLFLWVQIFTLILLFDFGWFREQFCLIMCPYGRFQSVFMDKFSLAIVYDEKRGEPRKQKGVSKEDQGDCINCKRCVNVCPTGIDIRDGVQMECIACTACIDACDEIMEKVNKPKGLISYSSEAMMKGQKQKFITPRNIFYSAILTGLIGVSFLVIQNRKDLDIKVVRAVEAPYQLTGPNQETVINHFRIHFVNQTNKPLNLESFKINSPKVEVVNPNFQQEISVGQSAWVHVFLRFSLKDHDQIKSVGWKIEYLLQDKKEIQEGELRLLAP